jgi:hypothetical protein
MEILTTMNSKSNDTPVIFLWEIAHNVSDDVIKYSTLFTPLLHCLLIYYTCDVNICVEMDPSTHVLYARFCPLEPGVIEVVSKLC